MEERYARFTYLSDAYARERRKWIELRSTHPHNKAAIDAQQAVANALECALHDEKRKLTSFI